MIGIKKFDETLIRKRYKINRNSILNFASNDYLQLANHPEVIDSLIIGAKNFGVGGSGSPQVCGYQEPHWQLEQLLCQFLKREKTILFSSGYLANLAMITTFAKRESLIIADKFCHASIIDGALLSRAKLKRYQHQNVDHADKLFSLDKTLQTLLITETIFSMEGNLTPLPSFVSVAKRHSAFFMLDDAHAVGILGETGAGGCEHFHLSSNEIDCLMTPFGKAIGTNGAAISGKQETIDAILQFAKPYRYSTAISPAISMASISAINIIKNDFSRREKLYQLIQFFNHISKQFELPFLHSHTPIQCLILKSNVNAIYMHQYLLASGLLTACIRPPTVPNNTARIRITLNIHHQEEDIVFLLKKVRYAYDQLRKN